MSIASPYICVLLNQIRWTLISISYSTNYILHFTNGGGQGRAKIHVHTSGPYCRYCIFGLKFVLWVSTHPLTNIQRIGFTVNARQPSLAEWLGYPLHCGGFGVRFPGADKNPTWLGVSTGLVAQAFRRNLSTWGRNPLRRLMAGLLMRRSYGVDRAGENGKGGILNK